MILDHINNINCYKTLHARFPKAIAYLLDTDFLETPVGKYAIDGEDIFSIIMEYDTKSEDECLLESHRSYIDIQYLVSGNEKVGISLLQDHQPSIAYDESKDIMFFDRNYESLIDLSARYFAIFFPTDLHMPCIAGNGIEKVKKVVMKIRVS